MSPRCLFLVLVPLVLLSGCTLFREVREERYNRNNISGERWLSDQTNPALIDVSGRWTSGDWGAGRFTQAGRRVRGSLGDYQVSGVVSGAKAYLLFSSGDWYYYSAVLEEVRPGLLAGHFTRAIPFTRLAIRPMRLKREN